jgi:hypothetical protein
MHEAIDPDVETLDISHETLAFIVVKARAFDAQAGRANTSLGAADEDGALDSGVDNTASRELATAIRRLSDDEQVALVALTWIGRGDFDAAEWNEAKKLARERHTGPTGRYLMSMPLLGDYLEEGAAALGVNLADDEAEL